jgi:hypothetical protein
MTRERELLERVISGDDAGDFFIGYRLYKDIETFLDQPEQEPKFNFDLERMKAAIESPISDVTVDDLAKQVKQEPVAWKVIDKTNGEYMFSRVKPMERSYKYDVVIPLYTAPPKRERITDEEIYNRCCAMDNSYTCNFIDGVEWAEEHHGIGGGK